MLDNFQERAQVLIEAVPYIQTFRGKTFVIKYGGNAMIDEELKKSVILNIILLKYLGLNPVIVHGGGPEITGMLKRVGKETTFVGGQRVTDAETMEIVNMILSGKINKELVALINQYGGKAVGISGHDGNLLLAKKRYSSKTDSGGNQLDLGFVGEVETINPELISLLIGQDYIPVIATVGVGADGNSYNINADTVAGEIAAALKAEKLMMLTDVEGIFEDPKDPATLISALKIDRAQRMIAEGCIDGGMIPKVEACINALSHGVERTHILDGRRLHSLLLEVLTDRGIGTMVVE